MATISKPNNFTSLTNAYASQVNSNFDTIYNDYNGNVTNVNINASAAIAATKINMAVMPIIGATTPNAATFTTISLSGGQVAFPATQAESADANTLDDYEENTWTPTLQFGGASSGMTYTTQLGTYTKIGRQVTINMYFVLSNLGTSTGTATIAGAPFTSAAGMPVAASLVLSGVGATDFPQAYLGAGSNTINLYEQTNGGVATVLNATDFGNTSSIMLSATYFV